MDEDDLQQAARGSGMRRNVLPSLEQVEKRRFELWLLSTILMVGLTLGTALLSMWSPADLHGLMSQPVVRFGVVGMALVLSAYSIEKERSLRRVSRLLMDERLLTTALANRLHEITTLLDAGKAVNSTLELDLVLSSILLGATDLMPAGGGSVMLLEGDELVVAAAAGNEGALGRRAAVGDGIAGHVARTREPMLLHGRAAPSMFPGLTKRMQEVGSSLCVPLIERGDLLGVLNLHAQGAAEFSEFDLRAVRLFAEQAATAISKARLYARSQQQAQELEYAATHDALTGIANRVAMDKAEDDRAALLFLDLDGFKQINDELGHAAGDEVLVIVAQRIRAQVSARDLPARFGGDEFAVLLADVSGSGIALSIADRVLAAIAQPMIVEGRTVQVTASIGVAVPATADTCLALLLRQADIALYQAKAAGTSCIRLYRTPAVSEPPASPELPAAEVPGRPVTVLPLPREPLQPSIRQA